MASKGNPTWKRGGASPNPAGRGAPFARSTVEKAKQAPGSDGVVSYSGWLSTGERNPRLAGQRKWVEYANLFNFPVVAIAAMLRSALFSGVKWTLKENPAGGKAARKGLDIVQHGLLDARLPKSWAKIAAKAGMAYFNGFSLHAAALGRRSDGMIVYTDLGHRPPDTIWQWFRPDAQSPWDSVRQRINDGETFDVPLSQCLYVVNDTLSDSPDGVGALRLVHERVSRALKYEGLEGTELFGSMGRTPIVRAPLEQINQNLSGTTEERDAEKARQTQTIRDAAARRIKTPEEQQWVMLDSATYQGADPNTISTIKKWDIETIPYDANGLPEIRKIIGDLHLDVGRMLGIEFVLVGGNDAAGTFGMHESKAAMFTSSMQSDVATVARCGDRQLSRRLVAANGLDADDATPSLVPSPITIDDTLRTAQTLAALNMYPFTPNHPAKIAIFDRMGLPWLEEDPLDLLLPRGEERVSARPGADTIGPEGAAPGGKPVPPAPPPEPKAPVATPIVKPEVKP